MSKTYCKTAKYVYNELNLKISKNVSCRLGAKSEERKKRGNRDFVRSRNCAGTVMEEKSMSELQKAIEEISHVSKKFPKRAFEIISANQEEALPYLRSAIEKAIEEKDQLDEDYQLHFYALFLLGEFQDKEIFPKIIELALLPEEVLDYLIGDTVTCGLKDILYNTYNGDMELLKNAVMDSNAGEFVRSTVLDVMGQLYLDGLLGETEWKAFIKRNVHCGEAYNAMYCGLGNAICYCHFVDMLPEIRYMLDNGLMDRHYLGGYDSCVDEMFAYRDDEEPFCEPGLNAAETLKNWAMFEEDNKTTGGKPGKDPLEKLMKEALKRDSKKGKRWEGMIRVPAAAAKNTSFAA